MYPEILCSKVLITDTADKAGDMGKLRTLVSSLVLQAQTCSHGKVIETDEEIVERLVALCSVKKLKFVGKDTAF